MKSRSAFLSKLVLPNADGTIEVPRQLRPYMSASGELGLIRSATALLKRGLSSMEMSNQVAWLVRKGSAFW